MTGDGIKALDSQGICSIIESCAVHGVTLLKLGDIQIEFGTRTKPGASEALKSDTHPTNPEAEISDKQHEVNQADALEREEYETKSQQLAELLITNPLEAERLLRDGELEDAGTDESDTDE